LFADFSPRSHEFNLGPAHLRLIVDEVRGTGFFMRVHLFSPLTIIPRMLHTHLYLRTTLVHMDKRAKPGNLKKSVRSEIGGHGIEKNF